MSSSGQNRVSRLDEAISAFLRRSEQPNPCPVAEFLAQHEHVRDLLEPMLAADADDQAGDDRDAEPIRVLGEFELLREIGRGGMGVVFEARQRSLNRRVAVKVLPAHLTLQASAITRFKREAKLAAALEHKGIAQVFAVGTEEDVHYFAMEFIDGAGLDRVMAESRTVTRVDRDDTTDPAVGGASQATEMSVIDDVDTVVRLIIQVADALEHAHQAGIVHLDVKPSNILVRPDGTTSLTDFGLARELGMPSVSMTGEFAGTPYYVSPERAMANRVDVDHRTDIYSLGATLYELAVLRRPFEGQTTQEILGKIIAKDPPDPHKLRPCVSRDLSAIILRAMEKDPDRRYLSAGEFAEDLRRYLSGHPVQAKPISQLQRWWRWARREPALAAAVAAVLLSLSLGLGISLMFYGEAFANAARAREHMERFQLLENVERLRQAVAAEKGLYPAWPDRIDSMKAWLREHAVPLVDEIDELRAALADSKATKSHEFAGAPALYRSLAELVADLEAFADEAGLVAGVRARLAWAEDLVRRSHDYEAEWDKAIAAIVSSNGQTASTDYRGLRITAQTGLVPLGADPESKYHEFAHLASGEIAERDPNTGKLEITDETGLVFVLVPALSFIMGSQAEDPKLPMFDQTAKPPESPPHSIALQPFLLSKYEMTQWQWKLLNHGEIPSHFNPYGVLTVQEITWSNPVEMVKWTSCQALLLRYGLTLPTEAQWEACCRAGSNTRYSTGRVLKSLSGSANLAKQGWLAVNVDDDGHRLHAPVGSFDANPFGFHDMHGNVFEWTLDYYGNYDLNVAPGTGLRLSTKQKHHIIRGGCYLRIAETTRCSFRGVVEGDPVYDTIGMRPARELRE